MAAAAASDGSGSGSGALKPHVIVTQALTGAGKPLPVAPTSASGKSRPRVQLRPCEESDMPAILDIYSYNVRNGYATCKE